MGEHSKRIIVAESVPEPEHDNFLHSAELEAHEEEIEKRREAPKELIEEAEPLFTEITSGSEYIKEFTDADEQVASSIISSAEIFKTCVLPDKTELQERILKTKNDILVGDHCSIGYGLYGNDIIVCELSTMHGDVVAEGDLRIDNFCEVFGTVICNGDAYLGEGVKIHGKLTVGGNLDIGDNVSIDKEFKAFGDIAIRNPMPVILYLLLYVMTMLNIEGEDKTVKRVEAMISEANSVPLVLPPKTSMDLSYFSVNTPMEIGSDCRLHGNMKAKSIKIKKDTTVFGSVQSSDRTKIGPRDAIHGDVSGKNVRIEKGADILGDVAGSVVWLHEDARVSGVIRADNGLTIGHTE